MRSVIYTFHPKGKEVMQVDGCGSYRRGKLSCGDVDILITRLDGVSIKGIIERLVIALEKENFLKERLGSLRQSHTGSEGYMGIC